MYLLWSYLPSPFLHQLGIHYYPDRWWALAIPSFLVMTIVYIYVALASYNTGYLTLPMSSIENIVDDAADIAVIDQQGKIKGRGRRNSPSFIHDDPSEMDWKGLWSEGTDAVMDVPLGGVCQILYGHD
jgi:phosphatidylinositol glycan class P protein